MQPPKELTGVKQAATLFTKIDEGLTVIRGFQDFIITGKSYNCCREPVISGKSQNKVANKSWFTVTPRTQQVLGS